MNSVQDKQVALSECMQEFNSRDQQEVETMETKNTHACAEFVRVAETFEINPNPIPHVHPPHEEKAVFCRWAAWFFTAVGLLVTILLTATAVDWPVIGAVGAMAVFLMLEFGVKLGISAAISEKAFVTYFHVLYWPWLGLLLTSIAVLWLGRNASPEFAAKLISYSTFGWCGAEIALLFLGALSFLGISRFGWSGRAVREVRSAEERTAELTKRVDRRNGKLLLTLFVLLVAGTPAYSQCPLVMVDFSGSLLDQNGSASRLVSVVADHATEIPCVRMVLFAERALSAEATTVRWGSTARDIFRAVAEARKAMIRDEAKGKLSKVVSLADRTPARCTSMVDVAARALLDGGPVLILTDGVHDCPPSRVVLPSGSSDRTLIVLAPSKRDVGTEYEAFTKRAGALRRLLPKSQIFPQSQIGEAVVRMIGMQQHGTTIKEPAPATQASEVTPVLSLQP